MGLICETKKGEDMRVSEEEEKIEKKDVADAERKSFEIYKKIKTFIKKKHKARKRELKETKKRKKEKKGFREACYLIS